MNSNNVDYNLSIIYLRKTTDWLAQSYKKKEFFDVWPVHLYMLLFVT